jgi:Zn-dependent M28 family amino/carboxypeptidase
MEVSAADVMLGSSPNSLADIQSIIDQSKKPASFETDVSVKIEVTAEYQKAVNTQNIIGILEGTDPALKNEYIIIGAHLDHLGSQGDGAYFPGANDNASGCAVLLKTAEELVKSNIKFDRTIIFALFGAEEMGILGSEHFVLG